ncbi:MAG TPA: NfeD family protein [Acidimicrobiales bacterium]|nr:NfeD family protein [Acidimicrobiales bacterium]
MRVVDVVQVSGYLDPIVVDFLDGALRSAEREGVEALIIQLDSPGALVDTVRLERLLSLIAEVDVPVAVWVGDSGASALGGAAHLVVAADLAGLAPGARIGDAPKTAFAEVPEALRRGRIGPGEAHELGLTQLNEEEAAVLGSFIAALDGHEAKGRQLRTADFREVPDGPDEATLTVQARLSRLPLGSQLLHTVASPPVAYLLLTAGLALLVFELFTAGVGIAGVVGAVSLALAGYGLAVLPTRPLGLALCLLGILGFSIDVQTGVPRFWTGVGVVSYTAGSVLLFGEGVSVGWLALVGGLVGVVLMMLAGLPATVRSRFSTPTIGRESMVGELGEATVAVAPEGTVRVRDALWPARTNRATPIDAGGGVRVVAIEGTVLEVEPEEGGARDYRERRPPS